jgi:hypothetical protein
MVNLLHSRAGFLTRDVVILESEFKNFKLCCDALCGVLVNKPNARSGSSSAVKDVEILEDFLRRWDFCRNKIKRVV